MDLQKLKNLAHLARLDMSDEELKKTAPSIESILNLAKQLDEVDTREVEPLFSTATHTLPRRLDILDEKSYRQEVLQNAPDVDPTDSFFAVPTILE